MITKIKNQLKPNKIRYIIILPIILLDWGDWMPAWAAFSVYFLYFFLFVIFVVVPIFLIVLLVRYLIKYFNRKSEYYKTKTEYYNNHMNDRQD